MARNNKNYGKVTKTESKICTESIKELVLKNINLNGKPLVNVTTKRQRSSKLIRLIRKGKTPMTHREALGNTLKIYNP